MIVLSLAAALAQSTVSGTARATAGTGGTTGLELRHTGTVFVRARGDLFRGGNEALYTILEDRFATAGNVDDPLERRNWVGRGASVELGVSPIPALRIAGILTSTRLFTRRGLDILEDYGVSPDTLGATYAGPELGVGHTVGPLSVFVMGGARVPVHASVYEWAVLEANGEPYLGRQTKGMQWNATVETRYTWKALVVDLEVGARHARPSTMFKAFVAPDRAPGRTYPTAALAVGWTGAAPWRKRQPLADRPVAVASEPAPECRDLTGSRPLGQARKGGCQ
jgi:hypothetical protein